MERLDIGAAIGPHYCTVTDRNIAKISSPVRGASGYSVPLPMLDTSR